MSRDHVFAQLGGRTVMEALEYGIDAREVWKAVCEVYDVPPAALTGFDDSVVAAPLARRARDRSPRACPGWAIEHLFATLVVHIGSQPSTGSDRGHELSVGPPTVDGIRSSTSHCTTEARGGDRP